MGARQRRRAGQPRLVRAGRVGPVHVQAGGERAASAGAIVGLAALVPYGIAASSTGVSGPGLNSTIHIIGSAAVLLVLLVPALERRMTAWLSGGGRAREAAARP
jgi:hypothetical protein